MAIRTLLALALIGSATTASGASREINETYAFDPDGSIRVENVNGDIEISGWDRDEIEFTAILTARNEDALDRIEVYIDASTNRFSVDTDYRKQSGSWWGNNNSGEVNYYLKVPAGAQLDSIESVNGEVTVGGVHGEANLSTVNGDVEAWGLTSDADLSTVNGSIDVSFDRLEGRQSVNIESVNGSLQINLPDNASARIDASTVHGRISSNMGLEVEKGRFVGSDMRDVVGGGEARVSLENVNGSIRVEGNSRR